MDKEIRKKVGKEKTEDPLKKLARINRGLKDIGCVPRETSSTCYRKIVGKMTDR